MKVHNEDERIVREFRVSRKRQLIAMAVTLLLLLALALLYKRHDLFGPVLTTYAIFGGQVTIIGIFIVFSAMNWRCPSCNGYLGPDISRRFCKRCRTRLQ